MSNIIRILGIDPALRNLGLVMADLDAVTGKIVGTPKLKLAATTPASGRKTVRKSSDDLRRCRDLYKALAEWLPEADVVCAETPLGSQNASAMKGVGASLMLLATIDKPLIELTPSEVKLAATGDKNATKAQMIEWGTTLYPEANWLRARGKPDGSLIGDNEHIADALAVIVAATQTDQFKLLSVGFKAK